MSYCARYDREPTALNYGYWSTIPTLIEQVPPLGGTRQVRFLADGPASRTHADCPRRGAAAPVDENEANVVAVESGAAEASGR